MRKLPPQEYRPSEDEPFMNPKMLEYFRQKLLRWRAELLAAIHRDYADAGADRPTTPCSR